MMNISKVILIIGGLVMSSAVLSAQPKLDPALQATSKEKFDDQAAAIRAQMKAGGHWEFVSGDERTIIERRLDEISSLLTGTESADALPADRKARLFSAQEEVNAILTKKDGRRLICENVSATGSHRKTQQCQTFSQRERERRESQKFMTDQSMRRDPQKGG
ncbi:MAG: hypothetical protein ABI411_01620 [Tahibacter sp.]